MEVATLSLFDAQKRFLVFGSSGWIGGKIVELLTERGYKVIKAKSRLEDTQNVASELDETKPDYVINAAGLVSMHLMGYIQTGRPNVDWCEFHKEDVVRFVLFVLLITRVNVVGTVALTDACFRRNIPITVFATGCIYEV